MWLRISRCAVSVERLARRVARYSRSRSYGDPHAEALRVATGRAILLAPERRYTPKSLPKGLR